MTEGKRKEFDCDMTNFTNVPNACGECEVCKYLEFLDYAHSVGKPEGTTVEYNRELDKYIEIKQVINKAVQAYKNEEVEKIKQLVVSHINHDWYASLGWGEDERIYKNALEELSWITEPLGITLKDCLNSDKETDENTD